MGVGGWGLWCGSGCGGCCECGSGCGGYGVALGVGVGGVTLGMGVILGVALGVGIVVGMAFDVVSGGGSHYESYLEA